MNDEDLLAELLLSWEERYEQGVDVTAAELCAELCPDRPHLVPILTVRIDLLRQVAWMTRPAPDDESPPGDDPPVRLLAGRYRLEERIGEGGFGYVWRGFDRQLQRPVAVKLPRPGRHRAGGDDAFLAEARRVAGLSCPGIVPVYDAGQEGGVTFIVSELIDGTDLAHRLNAGPLPIREAVRVVAEAARHLHHAHQRGFVHRDIKPANLLLDRAGRVFVTDFGIAVTRTESVGREDDGSGTLPYMSPERLAAAAERIDPRTDVYSLGVVLYELLTGYRPFGADPPEGVREAILNREPRFPPPLNRTVERICLKCLAKCPADRYPTAAALADDLFRWLNRRARVRTFVRWAAVGGFVVCVSALLFGPNSFAHKPKAIDTPAPAVPEPPVVAVPFEKALENGLGAQRNRDFKAAIMYYDEALKEQPKSLTAMGEKAYCYFALDRFDDASAVCAQMLNINVRAARAYYIKGLVLKKRKNYPMALEQFKLAAHYGETLAVHQIRLVEELIPDIAK